MTIIRSQTSIVGAKRLGETRRTASAPSTPSRDEIRSSLREAFAGELAELAEEARRDGLQQAKAELESAAERLESDFRKKLVAEQERRDAALASERERLDALAQSLQRDGQALRREAEAAALEIAYAAVTRLLGRQAADRHLLGALVAQVRQEHQLSDALTVRIASDDAAYLPVGGESDLEWVTDPALQRGECIVAFGSGRIEAGLAAQLDRIRDIFLESLADRHENA